jgi:hypothetical protein
LLAQDVHQLPRERIGDRIVRYSQEWHRENAGLTPSDEGGRQPTIGREYPDTFVLRRRQLTDEPAQVGRSFARLAVDETQQQRFLPRPDQPSAEPCVKQCRRPVRLRADELIDVHNQLGRTKDAQPIPLLSDRPEQLREPLVARDEHIHAGRGGLRDVLEIELVLRATREPGFDQAGCHKQLRGGRRDLSLVAAGRPKPVRSAQAHAPQIARKVVDLEVQSRGPDEFKSIGDLV